MLSLDDFRLVFAVAGLAGLLLIASPTLCFVLNMRESEKFSELWVLGSNHMAENYPFNVKAGENYTVYLGVGNHMGSSTYYRLIVKFRNQTEPLPNATEGTPSTLPPIFVYNVFLGNDETWEKPLTFSFDNVSFEEGVCLVGILNVNGVKAYMDKPTSWSLENSGYFYHLFVELWVYEIASKSIRYHNRFVGLWLNMTSVV